MVVEAITKNVAAAVTGKQAEGRPVSIEPVTAVAAEANAAVKEAQGSQQQNRRNEGEGEEKQPSRKQIDAALNHVNKQFRKTGCQFSYHEETNRVSIKVIDRETDEVIKEIPPEESLEMVKKMWELAGLLVDEKR